MDQNREGKRMLYLSQKQQLILALVGTVLLAAIMGTLAWLNYQRSLQTITRLQMPILWLRNTKGEDITSFELGNLDVSQKDSKDIPFGVYATADTSYILQLAHTTNIRLSYSIYRAEGEETYAPVGNPLVLEAFPENINTHTETYGAYSAVQVNAEPLYLMSKYAKAINKGNLDKYILRVSWEGPLDSNKETDMVYLIVATALDTPTEPITQP